MDYLKSINSWFWTDYVWLPPNITWNHLSDTRTVNYARFSDLSHGFTVALALFVVRYILEQYVFSPFGCYLGLKPKNVKILYEVHEQNILEKAFCENGKMEHKRVVKGLAKQLDWSERKVEQWFRRRLKMEKPSTLKKFTESSWRFTFFLCVFSYGLYSLWDKPWLWDASLSFHDFPHHSVTRDICWYYMIELGFYLSLLVSQFKDVKRKDHLQMLVHHLVSIALLCLSWTSNLFRIGSLLCLIHDINDIPLEASKIAIYLNRQKVADMCFVVFTVTWIITRLGIFPFKILYGTLYETSIKASMFPVFYVCFLLLGALQVINILWTWTILKIVACALSSKEPGVTDLRSDSDETSSFSSNEHNAAEDISSQLSHASRQKLS